MSDTRTSDQIDAIIGSTIAEIDGDEIDPILDARNQADALEREKIFLKRAAQAEAESDAARKQSLTNCLIRSIDLLVIAIVSAGIFVALTNPSLVPWIVAGWIALSTAVLRVSGLTLLPRNAPQAPHDGR